MTGPSVSAGAALYVAGVQFLFVTTWTVYAIYLPQLLETAGLPRAWAPCPSPSCCPA